MRKCGNCYGSITFHECPQRQVKSFLELSILLIFIVSAKAGVFLKEYANEVIYISD